MKFLSMSVWWNSPAEIHSVSPAPHWWNSPAEIHSLWPASKLYMGRKVGELVSVMQGPYITGLEMGGERWWSLGVVWACSGCIGGLKLAPKTLVIWGLVEVSHGVLGENSTALLGAVEAQLQYCAGDEEPVPPTLDWGWDSDRTSSSSSLSSW